MITFFASGGGTNKEGALLDLVLTNKEGLVEDVKVGGRLGCSDREMVEFRILHGGSRAISRIKTLDFRRANFGLFKELLGGILCIRALEIFKTHLDAVLCSLLWVTLLQQGVRLGDPQRSLPTLNIL